jgi:hypothetical protein
MSLVRCEVSGVMRRTCFFFEGAGSVGREDDGVTVSTIFDIDISRGKIQTLSLLRLRAGGVARYDFGHMKRAGGIAGPG